MLTQVAVTPGLFVEGPPPRLLATRCDACGTHHFPAHRTCPYCSTEDPTPVELAGHGRLWSWTAVTAAPPGYLGEVPYGFGVVELEEGIRVLGRLTEPDPSRLEAGQPMDLVIDVLATDEEGQEITTYAFAPSTVASEAPSTAPSEQPEPAK